MAPPTRKRKDELDRSEPGKTNAPLIPDAPTPMSSPNTSNPLAGTSQFVPNTFTTATGPAQQPAVAAAPPQNNINKFFLPQGEVSRELYKQALEEARITTEGGGHAALGVQGLLPSTRADLLDVPRETLTPDLQRELAATEIGAFPAEQAVTETDKNRAIGSFIVQAALGLGIAGAIRKLVTATALRTFVSREMSNKLGLGAIGGLPVVSQREKIKEAKLNNDFAKQGVDDAINNFNAGLLTYEDAVQLIRDDVANMRRNERTIKTLNTVGLPNFLTGGMQAQADVEQYLRHFNDTVLPQLIKAEQLKIVGARPPSVPT